MTWEVGGLVIIFSFLDGFVFSSSGTGTKAAQPAGVWASGLD